MRVTSNSHGMTSTCSVNDGIPFVLQPAFERREPIDGKRRFSPGDGRQGVEIAKHRVASNVCPNLRAWIPQQAIDRARFEANAFQEVIVKDGLVGAQADTVR